MTVAGAGGASIVLFLLSSVDLANCLTELGSNLEDRVDCKYW